MVRWVLLLELLLCLSCNVFADEECKVYIDNDITSIAGADKVLEKFFNTKKLGYEMTNESSEADLFFHYTAYCLTKYCKADLRIKNKEIFYVQGIDLESESKTFFKIKSEEKALTGILSKVLATVPDCKQVKARNSKVKYVLSSLSRFSAHEVMSAESRSKCITVRRANQDDIKLCVGAHVGFYTSPERYIYTGPIVVDITDATITTFASGSAEDMIREYSHEEFFENVVTNTWSF